MSNIASHGGGTEYQTLPLLFDDTYLFNQLEKLSLVVKGKNPALLVASENSVSTNVSNLDRYEKYTSYMKQLDRNIQDYETILAQSKDVNDQLVKAIGIFNSISANTSDFFNKTQDLYENYAHLTEVHECVPAILQHFDALAPIMRRLNHSSATIVRKNSFKTMLTNLDSSLVFLDSHPDLKDSEKYRIKFKQCLIRACELVSHYLKNLLNQAYSDINDKLSGSSGIQSSVSRQPLLYNKFAMTSEEYHSQILEITSRTYYEEYDRYFDELNSILNGCYDQYFQIRSKLLQPVTSSLVEETNANDGGKSLVNFIQDGKSSYQQLCIDEYNIFMKFFPREQSHQKINSWLCRLCEPLYDCVRTRILREADISMLCDSVTLFRQYYEFEETSEEYTKQFHDIKFDKIFEPIVQKLQARLILRVQIYIQENIVKHIPTKDSFIISRRKRRTEQQITEGDEPYDTEEISRNTNMWTGDMDSYYPTLRKALWLLSKIYEMVNSVVFDDLAHHIVHDCILSLRKAYDMVQTSSSGINNLDVKLAYLKNLLMLRQEIQNFNIQYTVNETYLDFSGVETFFKSVRDKSGARKASDSSSVFSVARSLVPRVVNSMVDARTELMVELRNIIKDFTDCVAKDIIDDTLEIDEGSKSNLLVNNLKLRTNIEEKLPHIHSEICNFIDDSEIVMHLVEAIQETVIQAYNDFYEEVSEMAENGALNKRDVSELMYNDVFADFMNKTTSKLTNPTALQ